MSHVTPTLLQLSQVDNMEAKLKSLKVAELKDLLKGQTLPAKANKVDLIARIIASKEATDAYNAKYAPKDDLLAPPEDLDWDADQVAAPETAAEPPVKTCLPQLKPALNNEPEPAPAPVVSPPPAVEDAELEKRKKRAERFGIPLVEVRQPVAKQPKKAPTKTGEVAEEKLTARAARFGTGQKRSAPVVEEVDAEEAERRRKRAERFA
ncbi:hypothetical protein C8F01DRAFT_1243539 [Mycena amicta]|nr:hypothetical protein C8F01DRAFT_1243539 [Mycena amicta]